MFAIVRFCILLSAITFSLSASAQDPFFETAQVPLDSNISITLVSRDTVSLDYYSLYSFKYRYDAQIVQARFMVPKHIDAFRGKKQVSTKICKLQTFINSWQGTEGEPIEVGDYLEVASVYGKEKLLHLNLDPELPDPVYTICGTQKKAGNNK